MKSANSEEKLLEMEIKMLTFIALVNKNGAEPARVAVQFKMQLLEADEILVGLVKREFLYIGGKLFCPPEYRLTLKARYYLMENILQ